MKRVEFFERLEGRRAHRVMVVLVYREMNGVMVRKELRLERFI
jgi:hypothetical protein